MPVEQGFPENERTIIQDPVQIPDDPPKPNRAALSSAWFDSPDTGLADHTDSLAVQRARELVDSARETANELREGLVTKNPYATNGQHLEHWERQANQRLKNINTRFADKLAHSIQEERERVSDTLNAEAQIGETPRAGEIRGHFRSLSKQDRNELYHQMMAEGDPETVSALTSAPGYLSGLTEKQKANLLYAYKKRVAPQYVARLEALDKAEEVALNAAAGLEGYVDEIKQATRIHNANRRAEAAQNLWSSDKETEGDAA